MLLCCRAYPFPAVFCATWAYGSTMNTCLDELGRRSAACATSLDVLLDTGWSPADDGETPEQHSIASRAASACWSRAIADLPEDMRAAIVLRDVRGFSLR